MAAILYPAIAFNTPIQLLETVLQLLHLVKIST